MDFGNTTSLESPRLQAMFLRHTRPWRHDALRVRVRYSRGADFSGTCYYESARLYVNLGRHLRYPYELVTHAAKAESGEGYWYRPAAKLVLADGYQLALFIYLHELYHYLVRMAGKSVRRREGMCDRFATRVLVDCYGGRLVDGGGRPLRRSQWDFQDLDAFVAAAPREVTGAAGFAGSGERLIPVRWLGREGK